MRKIVLTLVVVIAALMSVAAVKAAKQSLNIEGSTTVGPIADAFAEVFQKSYPDLEITVKKTGSGDGAAALVDGRCDVAIMSRFMKDKEFKKAVENNIFPVAHVVAMDGVCIVVHPSNPISELTIAQAADIYLGKITNWKELGGADAPIVAVSRDTSSGTYEVFHEKVMKKANMAPSVEYVNSNPQAHARVSNTVGGIAYVGIGFLDNKVKALKVDGVMPTKKTIASGEFAISRPLYMFTNGYPKLGSMAHKFTAFYLSEQGQDIIEAKGFVPVTNY